MSLRDLRRALIPCEAMSPPPLHPFRASVRAYVVMLSLFAAGCIFLVPEARLQDHCGFDGEGTECGACLRSACTTAIDDACRDPAALKAVVPPMESCAAHGDDACNQVPPSDVATCMSTRCAAVCYTRKGSSATRCTDSFLGPGLACSCVTTGAANDVRCATDAYPRARCCAPPGWPGPGLECACNAITCVPLVDGCNCVLTDNLDPASADSCRGIHCCAGPNNCQCRERVCTGGEREVDACTKAEISCPSGTTEVTSCAIRQ